MVEGWCTVCKKKVEILKGKGKTAKNGRAMYGGFDAMGHKVQTFVKGKSS